MSPGLSCDRVNLETVLLVMRENSVRLNPDGPAFSALITARSPSGEYFTNFVYSKPASFVTNAIVSTHSQHHPSGKSGRSVGSGAAGSLYLPLPFHWLRRGLGGGCNSCSPVFLVRASRRGGGGCGCGGGGG